MDTEYANADNSLITTSSLLIHNLSVQSEDGARNGEGRNTRGVSQSPRSLDTGDVFAADMDPFMALLRTRQNAPVNGGGAAEGQACIATAAASAADDETAAVVPKTPPGERFEQAQVAPFGECYCIT